MREGITSRRLGIRDIGDVFRLMMVCFRDDRAFAYVFRSKSLRCLWAGITLHMNVLAFTLFGSVDGYFDNGELAAVALWMPPGRFPFRPYVYVLLFPYILFAIAVLVVSPLSLSRMCRYSSLQKEMTQGLPESWYLGALAVRPEFRGMGIGRSVITAGLSRAQELGCPVSLHCWKNLIPYYVKQGFKSERSGVTRGLDDEIHLLLSTGF